MQISVVVCDDLDEERLSLVRMVEQFGKNTGTEIRIDSVASGEELLQLWHPRRWNVAFLDIYMDSLSGVETAQILRSSDPACKLVFATTSREHGMAGYKLEVMDYLVKPITQNAVNEVLEWYMELQEPVGQLLEIRSEWNTLKIPQNDIVYIEIQDHTLQIHMTAKQLETRIGLEEMMLALSQESFFKCHRSYIVNFFHVQRINGLQFYMDDGNKIPISRNTLAAAQKAILDWDVARHWK